MVYKLTFNFRKRVGSCQTDNGLTATTLVVVSDYTHMYAGSAGVLSGQGAISWLNDSRLRSSN